MTNTREAKDSENSPSDLKEEKGNPCYAELIKLKSEYLAYIDPEHPDEEEKLGITILDRLLDKIKLQNNENKINYDLIILKEISIAIALAQSDHRKKFLGSLISSRLVMLLEDYLRKKKWDGVSRTVPFSPYKKYEDKCQILIDKLKSDLCNQPHLYPRNYPWHPQLIRLENLQASLYNPHLVEGQSSDKKKSELETLQFQLQEINKAIIGHSDDYISSALIKFRNQLEDEIHKIKYAQGYQMAFVSYYPDFIHPNKVYIYLMENKVFAVYRDHTQRGKVKRVEVTEQQMNDEGDKDRATEDKTGCYPEGMKRVITKCLEKKPVDPDHLKKTINIFKSILNVKLLTPSEITALNEKFDKNKISYLLSDLKNTIKEYKNEVDIHRNRLGNFFRNSENTDMRSRVLDNLLNYVALNIKSTMSYAEAFKIIAREVSDTIRYIEIDHRYGPKASTLMSHFSTSKASELLRQFKVKHHLRVAEEKVPDVPLRELSHETNLYKLRKNVVDRLRQIKKETYNTIETNRDFGSDFNSCHRLEQLIQLFMRHPLMTVNHLFSLEDFCQFAREEINKALSGSERIIGRMAGECLKIFGDLGTLLEELSQEKLIVYHP